MNRLTINLGITCSTGWTSIGLSESGTVLAEMNLNIGRKQSSELPKAVGEVLRLSSKGLDQVDLLVLTNGPGSFTGVRVGLSYTLALAAARGYPVVPVNTLELMAHQAAPFFRGPILVPILKAKRGHYYAAAYRFNPDGNELSTLWEPGFYAFGQLTERLASWDQNVILIPDNAKPFLSFSSSNLVYEGFIPSGGRLALLGDLYFKRAIPFDAVHGIYLRPPDIG